MKLNATTLEALQNFAQINTNLIVDPDKPLGTISPSRTIVGKIEIEDEFPRLFGIYDLPKFLSCINLVGSNPDLAFEEKYVTIQGDSAKIDYFYSNPDRLNVSITEIKFPDPDIAFDLSNEKLGMIKKAAAALGHRKVTFIHDQGSMSARISEPDNKTSNSYSVDLGSCTAKEMDKDQFVIDVDNFKFVNGDYQVEYSSQGIAKFVHQSGKITYWIVEEK